MCLIILFNFNPLITNDKTEFVFNYLKNQIADFK